MDTGQSIGAGRVNADKRTEIRNRILRVGRLRDQLLALFCHGNSVSLPFR